MWELWEWRWRWQVMFLRSCRRPIKLKFAKKIFTRCGWATASFTKIDVGQLHLTSQHKMNYFIFLPLYIFSAQLIQLTLTSLVTCFSTTIDALTAIIHSAPTASLLLLSTSIIRLRCNVGNAADYLPFWALWASIKLHWRLGDVTVQKVSLVIATELYNVMQNGSIEMAVICMSISDSRWRYKQLIGLQILLFGNVAIEIILAAVMRKTAYLKIGNYF